MHWHTLKALTGAHTRECQTAGRWDSLMEKAARRSPLDWRTTGSQQEGRRHLPSIPSSGHIQERDHPKEKDWGRRQVNKVLRGVGWKRDKDKNKYFNKKKKKNTKFIVQLVDVLIIFFFSLIWKKLEYKFNWKDFKIGIVSEITHN